MAIKFFTDSCSDLPEAMANKLDVTVIPLMFTIEDKNYYNDYSNTMPIKKFYKKVSDGAMPTTSLINTQRYMDVFEPALKKGDDIVYIGFSSALSGSYQCSVSAADELKEKYPDRKIAVIDSKCASYGEGLYVYKIVNKAKEGLSVEEIVDYAEDIKMNLVHLFTVDDLNHLKRGGRLSNLSAAVGIVLKIKPVLHVNDEGQLVFFNKQRGRKKAVKELLEQMKLRVNADTKQAIFISHGDAEDDALSLGAMIVEEFENITEDDIHYSYIGPVIGAHSGPRTLALYFEGTYR